MAKFLQSVGQTFEGLGNFVGIPGMGDYVNGLTGTKSAAEVAQNNANNDNVAFARETNAQSVALANSAHQREVADLKAAGLNPVLSAGGSGAYTPGLSVPRVESMAPVLQTNAKLSNERSQVGLNAQQTASSIKLQGTQAAVNSAQVAKTKADTMQAVTQAQLNSAQARKINAEVPGVASQSKAHEQAGKAKTSVPQWMRNAQEWYETIWDFGMTPVRKTVTGAANGFIGLFK